MKKVKFDFEIRIYGFIYCGVYKVKITDNSFFRIIRMDEVYVGRRLKNKFFLRRLLTVSSNFNAVKFRKSNTKEMEEINCCNIFYLFII